MTASTYEKELVEDAREKASAAKSFVEKSKLSSSPDDDRALAASWIYTLSRRIDHLTALLEAKHLPSVKA